MGSVAKDILPSSLSGVTITHGLDANEKNAPIVEGGGIGSYVLLTREQNNVPFYYENALAKTPDAHLNLAKNGLLQNKGQISGMQSINVSFTGSLQIAGRGSETMDWTPLGTLVSGEQFNFAKTWDYIELKAISETKIMSFGIEHTCSSRFVEEGPVRYEAEGIVHRHNGWDYSPIYCKEAGASNGEYIGNLWSTLTMQFDHYAFRDGQYTMRLRFGAGDKTHTFNYSVNGQTNRDVPWGQEPGWGAGNFVNKDITVTLRKGWNHLEFGCNDMKYFQLDYVEIIPQPGFIVDPESMVNATSYHVEAENCQNWNATQNAWGEAARSMGVAAAFGDELDAGFTLYPHAMQAGKYRLTMNYWNAGNPVQALLGTNGAPRSEIALPAASTWSDASFEIDLKEGKNTIEIARGNTWCNFDYFTLEKIA